MAANLFNMLLGSLVWLLIIGVIAVIAYAINGKSFPEWITSLFWSFVMLAVGICIVMVGYAIYTFADNEGYIPHTDETMISAKSNWLVGESKDCWSATMNNHGAALVGKEIGYALSSISCDDGPEHEMKVTFFGREIQTEYKDVSWRCTRNEVSSFNDGAFTCYQTGGQQ